MPQPDFMERPRVNGSDVALRPEARWAYLPPHYLPAVAVKPGVGRVPIFDPGQITDIEAALNTASTSGGVTVAVRRNGAQVATLTIAQGSNRAFLTGQAIAVARGDYLTCDVTAAGTGAAELTVAYEEQLS